MCFLSLDLFIPVVLAGKAHPSTGKDVSRGITSPRDRREFSVMRPFIRTLWPLGESYDTLGTCSPILE